MASSNSQTSGQQKPMIGFAGLGRMGTHMATRLADAEYPLVVYNRTPEKTRALAQKGAQVAASPSELGRQSDVVIVMVSNDEALRELALGERGALSGMRRNTTLISMSTVAPATTHELHHEATRRGVWLLDAPVSGSTPQAEQGTLTIFVGGDEQYYERMKPILTTIGQQALYMGPSGMGNAMKMVANTLLGVEMQAIAEALALGERAGLEKQRLRDALQAARLTTPGQQAKLANAVANDYPPAFALDLMYKDFGLILALAAQLRVPMPATAVAQQMCAAELAAHTRRDDSDGQAGQSEDFSAIIRFMEELAATNGSAPHPHAPDGAASDDAATAAQQKAGTHAF